MLSLCMAENDAAYCWRFLVSHLRHLRYSAISWRFWRWVHSTEFIIITPLALMASSRGFSNIIVHYSNHQFNILYNDETGKIVDTPPPLFLELWGYFKHNNFGLISLTGCGTIALPTDPGNYDVCAPTWKSIACRPIGVTRFRLHDFFLGSCGEMNPMDPVLTSCSEAEMVKDVKWDYSATEVYWRMGVGQRMCRYLCIEKFLLPVDMMSRCHAGINLTVEESKQHWVQMRENIDEVISQVRWNRRGRMSRGYSFDK